MTFIFQKWSEWIANVFVVLALVSLLSPAVAAKSITPWIFFFIVNAIYMYDGIKNRSWPWVWLCAFCGIWDTLLIYSRVSGDNVFAILNPVVQLLEKLP